MTRVAYLSHPIGPIGEFEPTTGGERGDNLVNAGEWLKFLIKHTRWAIMCPWLAYTTVVDSALHGPRALTDQIMLLERCDILVQVGGWVSPHMEIEFNHASRMGLQIISLIDLGTRPIQEEHISRQVEQRKQSVEKTTPRRVWMPPLQDQDIAALRAAQTVLTNDPFSEEARGVIQRIVAAAMRR